MNDSAPVIDNIELTLPQALELAIRLQRGGDLEPAQIIYRRILALQPEHADALHFLGVAAHQSGDNATAIDLIQRSLALEPQANRFNNLGNVLLAAGQFAEATTAYQRAIALDAGHADAYNNLGALLKAQQRFDEAAVAYQQALTIDAEHVDAYNNMGNLLVVQGRVGEGVAYYCKAITLMPDHKEAKKLLGIAYYTLGEIDKAADVYRQWLAREPDNPIPRHHLAGCTREAVPERAADAYVEQTFDAFADSFDAKLGHLDYRAPQLIAAALQRECGTARRQYQILDAGCGTGLCGPLIADYAAQLNGVDLSAGMLTKAQQRQVYDRLIKAELTAYLQSQAAAFDIIVSADTLVYFGALTAVLSAARAALRGDGYLFFTVELLCSTVNTNDFSINPHGRYSHSENYLRRTLAATGFTGIALATVALRREGGKPVLGLVATARAGAGLER